MAVPHFVIEALFHFSRLFYFADKTAVSDCGFLLWAISYVFVRLISAIVIVLVFWFGLPDKTIPEIDFVTGNFNVHSVRMACLIGGILIQNYMMWNYINFQLKRLKEKQEQYELARKKKEKSKILEEEVAATGSKRTPQLRKRK